MNKLDLIIDALESCKETSWSMCFDAESVREALTTACELREMTPVATVVAEISKVRSEIYPALPLGIKLYALGDEK